MRGVKVGVDEIDLLAIRFAKDGLPECRHLEVQASMRPISYISRIPNNHLEPGQSSTSAKTRQLDILQVGVKEWVEKIYTTQKNKGYGVALPNKMEFRACCK